jgi:hypothetical protein
MKSVKLAFFVGLLAAQMTGCVQRIGDFTLLSSKNVDLSRLGTATKSPNRVTGEDAKEIIFVIPTGVPSVKEAIDRAIESEPGSVALSDATIKYSSFYIPYIFGRNAFTVEGTPVKLTDKK